MINIGIIGAGAWGTAFAMHAGRLGHQVILWAFEEDVVRAIREQRENVPFLPGFQLPPQVAATSDLAEACRVDLLVIVCPSRFFRRLAGQAVKLLPAKTPILILTKGIENESLHFMSEIMAEILPPTEMDRVAVLSGPNFAREVAEGMPTDAVAASANAAVVRWIQEQLHVPLFRIYSSDDVIGIQVGGAMKNVIAVAAGGVDGMGLGHNTRAALITRGLAEIARLGVKKGAQPLTFLGLAGIGDLVLTCTGDLSRNRTFGKQVARGESPQKLVEATPAVVEGYYTSRAAWHLAKKLNVDMPIAEQVYQVLHEGKSIQNALIDLSRREFKDELRGIS